MLQGFWKSINQPINSHRRGQNGRGQDNFATGGGSDLYITPTIAWFPFFRSTAVSFDSP